MRPFPLASLASIAVLAAPMATPSTFAAAPAAVPIKASTMRAVNAPDADVNAALEAAAQAHRIPCALLKGLAWQASRWRQFDAKGETVVARPDHVGLLGVWAGKRPDAERLKTDWRYNIEEGAKQLELCWYRAPIIGDGRLEDGRNIMEAWYYALGRYWDGRQGEEANQDANTVLDAIASGGEGRWQGVRVSRPTKEDMSWGRNVIGAPVPWHFGTVMPRPAPVPVVSLEMPYLNQAWDSPDTFDGSGSCGPTSMVMVLAFYKKVEPKPEHVTESYVHQTTYGGLIPAVHDKVCQRGMGAVHAKMLDYFRPMLPNAAIFYNEKATFARVKRELDAGRPCILGTEVTTAGHIMVARGYTTDGRLLVNDPAGDYYQAARRGGPDGAWSPTGSRYWNGDGDKAVYDWDALSIRWVMTFGPKSADSDRAEDEK